MASNATRFTRALALSAAAVVGAAGLTSGALAPAAAAPAPTLPVAAAPAGVALGAVEPGESYEQFIVNYKDAPSSAAREGRAKAWGKAARGAGTSVKELRALSTGGFVIKADKPLDAAASKEFMQELAASGLVESVEPDARMTISWTPNDARYGEQWGYHGANGLRMPAAWDVSRGAGSVVAVLDTGITSHADLNANVLPGYDFVSDPAAARDGNGRDNNPLDEGDWYNAGECGSSQGGSSSWHGTHVAGTVAAVSNNSTGVAGTAPDAKIVPVRVLAKCGGMLSDIADAITWASGGAVSGVPANPNPAHVINMSLGGGGACGTTYQNAINGAVSRGTTVVVAAGNEAQNAANVRPANCNNVVTVASSNPSGGPSYFTNFGSAIDVTAPGGDTRVAGGGILSTVNTGSTVPAGQGYAFYQGTSMATPHVAGIVAMMKAKSPSLTPAAVETALKNGTRAMPGGCTIGCGAGLVDAAKVMNALGGGSNPTPGTGQLLQNPGFESGSTGWTSSHADTFESGSAARTGTRFAGLNGWGNANTYTLDQQVAVPSGTGTAQLGFHLHVLSNETTASMKYDTLSVQVVSGSTTTTVAAFSNLDKSSGYSLKTVNLNAYKGQTVTIRFRGVEDGSLATLFRIDDTSLTVG
ncbi:S8 family serine peptidase [Zafaria sp. J156]|uniref:S8 family peptidase n=1 Tax=Zafaria sp. J156 TaxID=3116490 RepID=UPI002E7612FB|nr:S8 family peptidase [Zafaria sp. J156]MEE1622513.1 S8 family peptidase [Zafaria sp. J156]